MAFPGEDRWVERKLDVGEVKLHAMEAGEGPLVVLLHGFPDFWYGWRWQLGALAEAGFRVVAPDMRGYNRSDKPAGLWAYRLDALAADVEGLIRACGEESAAVVGHDWGGVVAWHAALTRPERVSRLAVLNAPTPGAVRATVVPPDQLLRSWYIAAFQVPLLPEAVLSAGDFALLRQALRGEVRRADAFTEADLDRYARAFAEPGALSAAIDYYRALLWHPAATARLVAGGGPARFERPALVVWGDRDPHLAASLAELDPAKVPAGRVVHVPDAGHWVQLEARERVTELLTDFLRAP